MHYKILFYTLSLFQISNFQGLAQAETQPRYAVVSEEILTPDYAHFESQLESLKTGNEFLKLRLEIMQSDINNEREFLRNLERKIDKIPQSLERLESKLLRRTQEQHDELNDAISKLNREIQTRFQEPPPIDDKAQMLSDIKEIVKDHDNLFENFNEKLKNIDKILNNPPWEVQIRELGQNISKNLDVLQSVDKKLTNIETITATKTDQIAFNRNIQKYFSKNEAPKICLRAEDQQLVCTTKSYPTNCADFNENYCANDICRLYNHIYGSETFLVSCDNHNEGGGWTVIQRRINGSVDFYRDWSEYKNGFGIIGGEFFIGLEKLHALTHALQPMELLIQLQDFNDTLKYAKYEEFLIGNEMENYKLLKVGNYTGNAGDSFSYHQGYNFTTKDRDNDEDSSNCATDKIGAWWYKSCMWSNLNGKYYNVPHPPKGERGICWSNFHGYAYSMKFVQMMIRPKRL